VGIVLAFSKQESYTEENTLDYWDLNNAEMSTINPQDPGPNWTLEIQEGTLLKLNVSASDTVRVRIATPTRDNVTGEEVLNIVFNQVGTHFTQDVRGQATTYRVEIKNEGITPVNISGNVKKIVKIYQTVFPYSSLGALVVLVGLTSLIYGILTKPKKRRPKMKARKSRRA